MTLVYERNMVSSSVAKTKGIVDYMKGQGSNKKTERAGNDPLWIKAREVYGVNRCDPVISYEDYLRITTIPENLELLKQGKVVILLDELSYTVTTPKKDVPYYLEYKRLENKIDESKIDPTDLDDTPLDRRRHPRPPESQTQDPLTYMRQKVRPRHDPMWHRHRHGLPALY